MTTIVDEAGQNGAGILEIPAPPPVKDQTNNFAYRMCVIGDLSPRQKIMATRLLRESDFPVIAMDEHNAAEKELSQRCEFLVLFRPNDGACDEQMEFVQRLKVMGWTRERVFVEGKDFPRGMLPGDPVTDHIKKVTAEAENQRPLMSEEEWDHHLFGRYEEFYKEQAKAGA